MKIEEALKEIRKSKERKFDQSIDLIINLKAIDLKKDNISIIAQIPNKIKERKICGFLTKESKIIKTILEPDFKSYGEKNKLKNLVKSFDFFVAVAPLMPKIASTFGKALGPAGKMPSPQLGILSDESDESIKRMIEKISTSIKIRVKEPSIKLCIGKSTMSDEKIIENINSVYKAVVPALPSGKDNIRKTMIKLSMGKPAVVEV